VVYVDDFVLAGKEEWHQRFWDDLSKVVQIDDVGDLGRFLGRHHSTVRVEGKELFAFDMRAYAQDIVTDYLRISNGKKLKVVNTPFFANGDIDSDGERGELANCASSILMKMMWLARLARPDLLRVTTWLATKIQKWCSGCDVALYRAICYIDSTKSSLLTGHINDDSDVHRIFRRCRLVWQRRRLLQHLRSVDPIIREKYFIPSMLGFQKADSRVSKHNRK